MKQVLIVSPHFPPVNAPDHQRVRLALPYLTDLGWTAHVLCVDENYVKKELDPELANALPSVGTSKVTLSFKNLFKKLNTEAFSWRSLYPLYKTGNKILAEKQIDLIYFSTTIFLSLALGPIWKKKFKIPYVIDIQDPWYSSFYSKNPSSKAPGGKLKFFIANQVAACIEPKVLKQTSGITSVSAAYLDDFSQRYPSITISNKQVIPFGGTYADFEHAQGIKSSNPIFNKNDQLNHWSYIGRGGDDLKLGVQAFCTAFVKHQKSLNAVVHCVGTSYQSGADAKLSIQPLAKEIALENTIIETPQRIPYFLALKVMLESQVLIVFGSLDAGYNASKLANVMLANKPTLAIIHRASPANKILNQNSGVLLANFDQNTSVEELSVTIEGLLQKLEQTSTDMFQKQNIDPNLCAKNQTKKLVEVFDKVVKHA